MPSEVLRALMKAAGGRVSINGTRSMALCFELGVPFRCVTVPVPPLTLRLTLSGPCGL